MQKCNILSHVVCTKILLIPSSGIHPDLGNLKTWQPERYAPSSAGPSRPFVKHLRSFQEGDFARRPVSLPYLSAANELYVVICGLLILICDKKEREREKLYTLDVRFSGKDGSKHQVYAAVARSMFSCRCWHELLLHHDQHDCDGRVSLASKDLGSKSVRCN